MDESPNRLTSVRPAVCRQAARYRPVSLPERSSYHQLYTPISKPLIETKPRLVKGSFWEAVSQLPFRPSARNGIDRGVTIDLFLFSSDLVRPYIAICTICQGTFIGQRTARQVDEMIKIRCGRHATSYFCIEVEYGQPSRLVQSRPSSFCVCTRHVDAVLLISDYHSRNLSVRTDAP